MARPVKRLAPPKWFDVARYAAASDMDAADWYLNLSLRRRIARTGDPRLVEQVRLQPLIRRAEVLPASFSGLEVDPYFLPILHGRSIPSPVRALSCDELYSYERLLPAAIQDFGRSEGQGDVPPGFRGPVDHQFSKRFTFSLAFVDLSMPDDVLERDMKAFIAAQRAEHVALGGRQPYRAAIDLAEHSYGPRLKTWAMRKVLALMDLHHWREATSAAECTDAQLTRRLDIDRSDFRQARADVDELLLPFALEAWLLPLVREIAGAFKGPN